MAYMVYQRLATAIRDGYGGERPPAELRAELADARRARAWLEGLQIDPSIRASLVEPIAVVEEAISGLLRERARSG